MKTEEIVQNYQIKLLKIIFKEIDNLMTKKENADINAHKLAENGDSVRTSAYWKSVGNAEFYIKEIYQKLSALAEIESLNKINVKLQNKLIKLSTLNNIQKPSPENIIQFNATTSNVDLRNMV